MFLNYKELEDLTNSSIQNLDHDLEILNKDSEKLRLFYQLIRSQALLIKTEGEKQQIPPLLLNFNQTIDFSQSFIYLFREILANLESNTNSFNVLIAYNLIQLIANNKYFYSIIEVLQIIDYFISRISILPQLQISKLSLNQILRIISFNYQNENSRSIIKEHFTFETFIQAAAQIKHSNTDWLEYLSIYTSYQHSQEDALVIIRDITQRMDNLYTNYELAYFTDIIINLIKNETLPLDAFIELNFHQYLKNIILIKSNTSDLIEKVLYSVGLLSIHGFNLELFDIVFLLSLFHQYKYNHHIIVILLWCMSSQLSDEICDYLIEQDFLNEVVDVYHKCEAESKSEIVLFITDLMWVTSHSPQLFLSPQITEILIESIPVLHENEILKIVAALYQTIEDCIVEDADFVGNIKQTLFELNFIDIVEYLHTCNLDEIESYANKFELLLNENE